LRIGTSFFAMDKDSVHLQQPEGRGMAETGFQRPWLETLGIQKAPQPNTSSEARIDCAVFSARLKPDPFKTST